MAVDAEMSFWDHLEDLRWMLMRVVIALAVFYGCIPICN